MVVSVDGLLERLGSGYQFLVFLLVNTCLMHVALNQHVHHYYLATPPHSCKLPEGWKEEDALPTVLMAGKGSSLLLQRESPRAPRVAYSSCRMYIDPRLHRKGTMACVYGYVFTLQASEWSIVAEWGLVCDRDWIKHWVVTSYLIGLVIGGLLFGFLADRFGRRNLLVVCVTTVGSLGVALHFVRRLVVFLCLRFIQAIFVQGVYVTSWTLAAELFPPKWRCRALVAGGMAKPLGVALGALVALMVQHWRAVQLATSLPVIISLLYCWLIPESLRWLLTRGKTRRACLVAAQLARHNLLTLPPTAHAQMEHLAAHVYLDVPWGSLLTLFKTPRLRRHTLIVVFMWLAVSLADSSFRNELAGLGGPPGQLANLLGTPGHLGSLLGAGVEAGAVVLAAVLTAQLYRRAFLVLSFLVTAALAIVVVCVLQLVKETSMDVDALATGLRFLGVLVVGGARVGVVVVSVEVTPTTARASAVGLCAAHAAMGEVLAPLLALVAELTYPSVPWLTSAGGCLIAALLALFLPETAGTTLPDVVDESEVVGLCSRGDLLKACDGQYGKSPSYWLDDDDFVLGRGAVSDAASQNDDGDKFKSLDRNLDCRWVPKASGRGDKEVRQLAQVAGPSQVMVLPHVQTRRRGMRQNLSRSSDSLASSCSRCSMVSLVDVSKVNGNNSDTTDTTDSNYFKDQKEIQGQVLAPGTGAEENIYTETTEVGEQRTTTASLENKENVTGEKNSSLKEKNITSGKRHEQPEEDAAEADEELKTLAAAGPLESDVSISVCSLQFKHIRRPVSPTDRRRGSGLYYSSSSAYETSSRRSLIQEYMSRNSFRGDTSGSRYATLLRKKEPAEAKADGGRITTEPPPSYILKECIRIARDEERLGGLRGDASKRTKADLRSPFQHHPDTTSSRGVSGASSSATDETAEPNLFRVSFPSDGSLSTANNFTPSSTLEYEAGGLRGQVTARTLRYDTLRTTNDPGCSGQAGGKFDPLSFLDASALLAPNRHGVVKYRPEGHQVKGQNPRGHQPKGHHDRGHDPKGHQPGVRELYRGTPTSGTGGKSGRGGGEVVADGTGGVAPVQGTSTTTGGDTAAGASTRGATAVSGQTRGGAGATGALTRGVGVKGGRPVRAPTRGATASTDNAGGASSSSSSTSAAVEPSPRSRGTTGAPLAELATRGATGVAPAPSPTRVTGAKATDAPTCLGKRHTTPEYKNESRDAQRGLGNTQRKDTAAIRRAIAMKDLDETNL